MKHLLIVVALALAVVALPQKGPKVCSLILPLDPNAPLCVKR